MSPEDAPLGAAEIQALKDIIVQAEESHLVGLLKKRALAPWSREDLQEVLQSVEAQFQKRIIGQQEMVRSLLMALVLNEHVLLEGLPGVGKTEVVKWVAEVTGLPYSRVQFIPDMLPSDLVGKDRIDIEKLDLRKGDATEWVNGPIFSSIVLADEINRAPSKVQAALLEAMGERQVTPFGKLSRPVLSPLHGAALAIWMRHGHKTGLLGVPRPVSPHPQSLKDFGQFTVFATMNPIEQEGTYPLSEAQTDRFGLKVVVPYPSRGYYEEISNVVFEKSSLRPIESKLSFEKCCQFFESHPDSLVPILLPMYFFLRCRACITPIRIDGQALMAEDKTLYGILRGRQAGLLQRIYDIVYMTNARANRVNEGESSGAWYDREQLEMRQYINNLQGTDGEAARAEGFRRILEQKHCRYVKAGASPRGFLKLVPATLAYALIERHDEVQEADVIAVLSNTLRHRIHMDVHARLAGMNAEEVIHKVSEIILAPGDRRATDAGSTV
jgi:MoxR-like ATPase